MRRIQGLATAAAPAAAPGGATAGAALAALLALAVPSGPVAGEGGKPAAGPQDRFDTVVIDPGHGGEDQGARGLRGIVEKDLVLDVSQRLAERLRARELTVVMTREEDVTVPLETRTSTANDARGDLFLSVHANSARVRGARGVETYFVSLEASDAEAGRVAARENQAFGATPGLPAAEDPLVALLGDLIATEHVNESQVFARLAQGELAELGGAPSRGVKQAPFVVLMGVQMPAALVEIGFVSNPREAAALDEEERREALAAALARSVERFARRTDAKRGARQARPAAPAPGTPPDAAADATGLGGG